MEIETSRLSRVNIDNRIFDDEDKYIYKREEEGITNGSEIIGNTLHEQILTRREGEGCAHWDSA